jgi:hypothetical protein
LLKYLYVTKPKRIKQITRDINLIPNLALDDRTFFSGTGILVFGGESFTSMITLLTGAAGTRPILSGTEEEKFGLVNPQFLQNF